MIENSYPKTMTYGDKVYEVSSIDEELSVIKMIKLMSGELR